MAKTRFQNSKLSSSGFTFKIPLVDSFKFKTKWDFPQVYIQMQRDFERLSPLKRELACENTL